MRSRPLWEQQEKKKKKDLDAKWLVTQGGVWLSKAGIFLCPEMQWQESEEEASHLPCLDLTFPFAQWEAWVHMTSGLLPQPSAGTL